MDINLTLKMMLMEIECNEINNFFIQYKLDSNQLDVTVDSTEPDA